MIKKNKRTKNLVFISLLLCYILISLFEPFGIVKAYAGINRSITSDSDRVAIVDNNGNLKFSVKAVGASSGTRWKTVGLYVTSDPTGRNGKESTKAKDCNGVQREHNKKLNNGLPILHKVPPKRDYGRYFCIMAEKGGTSHGGLTEKLSPFFHAKKQEVNAYGR